MRLRVMTLQNVEIEIIADENETILDVKKKLFAKNGQMFVEQQKLIHAGKILKNEQFLKDYTDIKDNDRLVVFIAKPTPNRNQSSNSTSSNVSTPAVSDNKNNNKNDDNKNNNKNDDNKNNNKNDDNKNDDNKIVDNKNDDNVNTSNKTNDQQNITNTQLNDQNDIEKHVQAITQLGYSAESARNALQLCSNNIELAIDLLMSFPEQELNTSSNFTPNVSAQNRLINSERFAHLPPEIKSQFEKILRHPSFEFLKQAILTNPSFPAIILEQLRETNPELVSSIENYEEEFIDLLLNENLNEDDLTDEELEGDEQMIGDIYNNNNNLFNNNNNNNIINNDNNIINNDNNNNNNNNNIINNNEQQPSQVVISLTQTEITSIERLEALGFTRAEAVEAFLICDKNEMIAANFLFDSYSNTFDSHE